MFLNITMVYTEGRFWIPERLGKGVVCQSV
jgi:hypothetical protein